MPIALIIGFIVTSTDINFATTVPAKNVPKALNPSIISSKLSLIDLVNSANDSPISLPNFLIVASFSSRVWFRSPN